MHTHTHTQVVVKINAIEPEQLPGDIIRSINASVQAAGWVTEQSEQQRAASVLNQYYSNFTCELVPHCNNLDPYLQGPRVASGRGMRPQRLFADCV
jgi:hypothetical protein